MSCLSRQKQHSNSGPNINFHVDNFLDSITSSFICWMLEGWLGKTRLCLPTWPLSHFNSSYFDLHTLSKSCFLSHLHSNWV